MAVSFSTGLKNNLLGKKSLRDLLQGCVLKIYSGQIPETADSAINGTLLCIISNNSQTIATKQEERLTFNYVNDGNFQFVLKLNGLEFIFNAEVRSAYSNVPRYIADFFTNNDLGYDPPVTLYKRDFLDNLEVLVSEEGNSLTFKSKVAGIPFDLDYQIIDIGNTGVTISKTIITPDSYGLHFESKSLIENGILEKKADQIWSGKVLATGTASFGRLCFPNDSGAESFVDIRIQGNCGTSLTSDFRLTHLNLTKDEVITCSNFAIKIG